MALWTEIRTKPEDTGAALQAIAGACAPVNARIDFVAGRIELEGVPASKARRHLSLADVEANVSVLPLGPSMEHAA